MTERLLIYLHGFRSSPLSTKSRIVGAWMAAERPDVAWWCPQLPPSPRAAVALVEERMAGHRDVVLIGSSLGGFYATVLAERHGVAAALLNPAVNPARDLAARVGVQSAYHDTARAFEFSAAHIEALRAMTPAAITRPERYVAVVAKGDELLDWRETCARYAGARIRLLEGSDHGLSDFALHLPFVMNALGLAPVQP